MLKKCGKQIIKHKYLDVSKFTGTQSRTETNYAKPQMRKRSIKIKVNPLSAKKHTVHVKPFYLYIKKTSRKQACVLPDKYDMANPTHLCWRLPATGKQNIKESSS